MIIAIGAQKGGSGKSAVAQNLAVALAKQGENIMLVDADPQKTTADWAIERKESGAGEIDCQAMTGDIRKTLLTLEETGKTIIVDCGGRDSTELRSALVAADLVIIPTRPKRRDLKTLDFVSTLIETSRINNPELHALTLITQAPALPSQVQRILDAKAVSESFGIPSMETVIYMRNAYDDAEEDGLSVIESSDVKAKEEVTSLVNEVFKILGVKS